MYAVHILDLENLDFAPKLLLFPVLKKENTVTLSDPIGDNGAVLNCPDTQAESIIEIFKMKNINCRFYKLSKKGNWRRIE